MLKRLYHIIRWYTGASLNYIAMKLLKLSDHINGSNTVIISNGYYLVKAVEVKSEIE